MNIVPRLCTALLLCAAPPALAQQQTPAPAAIDAATAPDPAAAPELTEAEQKTLKKCQAMSGPQQAQNSKCSKVMVKAGKPDPAKDRGPASSTNPPA